MIAMYRPDATSVGAGRRVGPRGVAPTMHRDTAGKYCPTTRATTGGLPLRMAEQCGVRCASAGTTPRNAATSVRRMSLTHVYRLSSFLLAGRGVEALALAQLAPLARQLQRAPLAVFGDRKTWTGALAP